MDTNCLGGRRNKQKPQENLKQKEKQNYHYHPQQQPPQGHTHQHQQHHYLQQNQEPQNYPLDFYQKSTYRTEENLENSIIGSVMYPGTVSDGSCSSSTNSGNSQQNYINTPNQQQQNSCTGIIYPHFPPPPDYPPPMIAISKNNTKQNVSMTTQQTDIPLLSASQNITGTQLTPTTSGLIPIQTTATPVTTISSLLSATSLAPSGAGDNGISSSGTASIINLNSGSKIGSRKGILHYQQQQNQNRQHHYPDLDLDAIEICNEQDIIIGVMEPKPSSSSSIKALLRNKNTGNNIIGNIRQYNYNNNSTNNSTNNNNTNNNNIGTCDSSNSSNISINYDNNHSSTLENTNVKWSRNIQLHSIDDFQHQQQQYHHQQEHEQQTSSSSLSPIISAPLHPIEIAVNPSGFGGIIHHPFHQDYSYAYYEPGAAMRHSNIPQPEQQPNNSSSGQSNRPPPPPNSIRALLSKGKKNKLLVSPATRQSYQTKFNQHHQENFYEEISNETAAKINIGSGNCISSGGGNLQNPSSCGIVNTSIGILNHSMVEDEFLRVQNRHHKILGELNLSVEAMLMPESIQHNENSQTTNDDLNKFIISKKFPSSNSIKTILKSTSSTSSSIKSKNSVDNLVDLMNTIGPSTTDNCDLLSPLTCETNQISTLSIPSQSTLQTTNLGFCGDLDSGFSGSSGASYIGSLRYHKTNAALSNLMTSRKTTILQPSSSSSHQNDVINFDNSTLNSNNDCTNEQQNQFNIHQDNDNMINLNNLDDTFSANSSCRSSQRSGGGGVGCDLNSGISGGIDTCSGNNSGFIIRSSHTGKKILNFSKLKAMEDQQQIQQQTKPESNARSFWNRKGYKKSPGFSSTSNINQTGIIDETKLNSSSWEDPLPIAKSQTITTAQLHNTTLRRLDPLHSRASYNCKNNLNTHHQQHINSYHHYRQQQHQQQFILPTLGHHQQNSKNFVNLGGNNIIGRGGGGDGIGVDSIIITEIDNQIKSTTKKSSHKRLEHTPSARTINSSEESWCSEEHDDEIDDIITSEDDEDNNSEQSGSITSTIVVTTSPALNNIITTATQQQQQQQRNSQLRSTFNKAKQHLSFDKWRTSGGAGGNNSSNNSSSSSPNSQQSSPQFQQQQQKLTSSVGGNSDPNILQSTTITTQQSINTNNNSTMPIAAHPHPHIHHHHNQDTTTTTPGETPGGRLSRWFSIRRGSTHQYDVGGRDGRNSSSSSSSIDATDTVSIGSGGGGGSIGVNTDTNNLISKAAQLSSGSSKMPQLPENEDDSTHTAFDLDLMLPPGSRANGTARPHARLITPMLPPAPPGLSQQQLKRRHIVAAIVHSENSYVATLQRLVNDYKKPLEESSPPILSSSKISTLFHRLPEILQSHKMFRIALADCVRNWDRDEKLGDVFVSAFSKPLVLEIYSGFINNFSAAMELAKMEAKRKSALADFFKVKQISAHDRLSFFGLMVKPVQRFPQFILFLQDLLKYTPQGHHDRINLQLALTQLESLAEMLNERKREAEQYQAFKEMLGHISGTFNTRSLASTSADGNRHRYLLREDNVTQMEFNQAGFIIKSKQRRLLLLNDKVICVSVAPKQSHDFGATEKLSFKWMYPVTDVEIVDNSTSATLSRILTAGLNRGGSLKSNSSSCNNDSPATILTNGADNLCNEMSTLMYDYEVISRMNDLVSTLKGTYKEINTNITRNLMNTIQNLIQRKDEEMAWVDSCCLQLIARNKSGKEETFTFQTETPSVKKEWITELRLAQLALDQNNSPAWEIPEHEHRPSTKMPLFVKAQPVYKSQHQTEVRCGCYYSIQNDTKVGTARRRHKRQNYLWVCTSDGQSSHIAILSQHHQQAGNLKDVGSFDLVETQITSMEFIKGLDYCKTKEEHNSLLGDLIWMGTDSRKILIYSATNPEQEEQLGYCSVPGIVTKIIYHFDSVYVALTNSTMLIFRRAFDGVWILKDPQVIQLGINNGSLIVSSILPINMNIYASCGNRVAVLNAITGEIQKSFEIQHGTNQQVNLMAHSGIGLWISLKNSSIICLYHTETFKHLQDINIAANVLRVKSSSNKETINNGSIHVTALLACKGLLWVGTNVGIALTIPLPRLEGVPIISGGVSISCHAHFGPITFLLPLVPKSYNSYKSIPPTNIQPEQPALINEDNEQEQTNVQNNDDKKKDGVEDDLTVILRKDNKDPDDSVASSEQDSPKTKLDKQNPLDLSFSAKLRAQLANSPALRRKRYREMSDISRMSKTLPRGLGSPNFFNTSINSNSGNAAGMPQTDHGYCDVYGLYGKLIFVKEDYDAEEGAQGNLFDMMYECMRRSDPELAAIPGKVSTLDRRLRMKASRPRSLDLSNWSVDSKSSSLYTSSGSEESVGMRLFGGRSVSRNSSSASHKTSGNGSDLGNISENGIITVDVHTTSTNAHDNHGGHHKSNTNKDNDNKLLKTSNQLPPPSQSTITGAAAATMKRKNKSNNKHGGGNQNGNNGQSIDGPRTLLTLMGGRGYWRHVWYTNSPKNSTSPSSSGTMSRVANSNDAHIVIWEKKL